MVMWAGTAVGVVAHVYNLSIQEAETGRSQVQGKLDSKTLPQKKKLNMQLPYNLVIMHLRI
jgi:hypothetical protein